MSHGAIDLDWHGWQPLWRLLEVLWEQHKVLAAEPMPWPDVLALVEPSNIAAQVFALAEARALPMPCDARSALEHALYRAVAGNARHVHQLSQVGRALASTRTPLLLLKGAAVAETLYEDSSLRLMGDIDLAIPRENLAACRQMLLDLGYTAGLVEHRAGSALSFSNQVSLLPPEPFQATVELHWHLLDAPYYVRSVPMEWFWEHSESASIAGEPFRILCPEANLIYLPAHLALHHRFRNLHPFLDLALLVVRFGGALDWDRIAVDAQRFGLLSPLRETLRRLASMWPSLPLDGPRRLLDRLEASPADARLFRLLSADSRSVTLDFYTTLVTLPGLGARARYAWLNLFPQPAYMRARYPVRAGWHLPYWYVTRIVGGLTRLVATLPRARRLDLGGR